MLKLFLSTMIFQLETPFGLHFQNPNRIHIFSISSHCLRKAHDISNSPIPHLSPPTDLELSWVSRLLSTQINIQSSYSAQMTKHMRTIHYFQKTYSLSNRFLHAIMHRVECVDGPPNMCLWFSFQPKIVSTLKRCVRVNFFRKEFG